MKAILLDEAKKWLEENCENQYTRMAVFGIMQSMPAVDYQETPNEPLTLDELREMNGEPVYVVEELNNGARFESWALIGTQKWGYVGLYNQLWQSDYETQARHRNTKYYRRPPEGNP